MQAHCIFQIYCEMRESSGVLTLDLASGHVCVRTNVCKTLPQG